MTLLSGLPGPRLDGVWFAEAGEAREALPAHAEQELDRRVWKEQLPLRADRDLVYGAFDPLRSWEWAQTARRREFGVVVELSWDWGPGRLILPEVHVTWDQWPYAMAMQFHPDVMARVREMRRNGA